MTADLRQEFVSLSEKARKCLRDVPASGSYRHVFSFWTMPSLTPAHRCSVFSPAPRAKEKKPFAAFTTWRSDIDWGKLSSPIERLKHPKELAPTFEDDVVWLSDDLVEEAESRIQGVCIPFFLPSPSVAGLDGTSFSFRYDTFMFGGELHWKETYPTEWRPFTSVVMGIAKELEGLRGQRPPSNAQSG